MGFEKIISGFNDNPEFRKLTHDQKSEALRDYFDTNLADSEFFNLPYDEQDRIKQKFVEKVAGKTSEASDVMLKPSHAPLPGVSSDQQGQIQARPEASSRGGILDVLSDLPEYQAGSRVLTAKERGDMNVQLGLLRSRQVLGEDSPAIRDEIARIKKQMPPPDTEKRSLVEQAFVSAAEMAPIMVEGLKRGAGQGAVTGAGFAGLAALAGGEIPPLGIVTVPGAFAAGYGVGSISGSAENIARIEAGLAYDELLDLKDENGKKLSPSVAKNAAAAVGIINGAIEFSQLSILLKSIPGGKQLVQGAIGKAVQKAVAGKTLHKIALNAGLKYAGTMTLETGQELLQESTNILVDYAAAEIDGLDKIPQLQKDQIKQRLADTAKQSALAFAVMLAPGHVVTAHMDAQNTLLEEGEEGMTPEEILEGRRTPQQPPAERTPAYPSETIQPRPMMDQTQSLDAEEAAAQYDDEQLINAGGTGLEKTNEVGMAGLQQGRQEAPGGTVQDGGRGKPSDSGSGILETPKPNEAELKRSPALEKLSDDEIVKRYSNLRDNIFKGISLNKKQTTNYNNLIIEMQARGIKPADESAEVFTVEDAQRREKAKAKREKEAIENLTADKAKKSAKQSATDIETEQEILNNKIQRERVPQARKMAAENPLVQTLLKINEQPSPEKASKAVKDARKQDISELIDSEIADADSTTLLQAKMVFKHEGRKDLTQIIDDELRFRDEIAQRAGQVKKENPNAGKPTTLGGAIRMLGGIKSGNLKSDILYTDKQASKSGLLNDNGLEPEKMQKALVRAGWMLPSEDLTKIISSDTEKLKRGILTDDKAKTAFQKKQQQKIEQSGEGLSEMPPDYDVKGAYQTVMAGDLPEGKRLGLVVDGVFDTYTVVSNDIFGEGITLRSPSREMNIEPAKAVDVRVSDLEGQKVPGIYRPGDMSDDITDDTSKFDYSSTQLNLPKEHADSIKKLAAKIPESEIKETPDMGPEDEPHVTVKYGLHTADPRIVAPIVQGTGPITAKLGKVSVFENDDADVLKVDVESQQLTDLNQKLSESLPATETFPDYKPHITIAYLKKGEGKKYVGDSSLEGTEITFNDLTFSGRDGTVATISLTDDRRQISRGSDRRTDNTLRQKYDEMSEDDRRKAIHVDDRTGLLNARAYKDLERLPVQASIDMDSLKYFNDTFGHQFGDAIIKLMGDALKNSGLERVYHPSGDEFWAEAQTPDEIVNAMDAAEQYLSDNPITFEHPDGSQETYVVRFAYGKGSTLEESDKGLQSAKSDRLLSGIGTARGKRPQPIMVKGPKRKQAEDQGEGGGQEVAPPAEQSKRQKAMESYRQLVDGLDDEQRALVEDLIQEEPQHPAMLEMQIRKALKSRAAKPARWSRDQWEHIPGSDGSYRSLFGNYVISGEEGQIRLFDQSRGLQIGGVYTDRDTAAIKASNHFAEQNRKPAAEQVPHETESASTGSVNETDYQKSSSKLAQWVYAKLNKSGKSGEAFTWRDLFVAANDAFGGTQAEGKYTPKDAYDAMEAGVNAWIIDHFNELNPNRHDDVVAAVNTIKYLAESIAKLPTQTKRTVEQQKFQQFSTPPPLSFIANWVGHPDSSDVYLEPSAGIGGLAVFAKKIVKQMVVNELSDRRASILKSLGFDPVFSENAEQLDNILPYDVKPTLIVMNPPFSSTAGRVEKNKTRYGAQHVEQALARLEPGGRLVAIVGRGMADNMPTFRDWWIRIKKEYNVRANVGISGKNYTKYGTSFDNQILVIDKTGPTDNNVITGYVNNLEELPAKLQEVRNDRPDPANYRTEQAASESTGTILPNRTESTRPASKPGAERPSSVETSNGGGGGGPGTGSGGPGTKRNGPPGSGEQGPAGSGQPSGLGELPPSESEQLGGRTGGQDKRPESRTPDLKVKTAAPQPKAEITDSIFEQYHPKAVVDESRQHPTPLVESAAMADTEAPDVTYVPNLPREIITGGKDPSSGLSASQLENVIYAGQSHELTLPDGRRRGYFIGDGTGVGKGREISGIIYDNWRNGRKKAVWVSESWDLIKDAARDLREAGWQAGADQLFSHKTLKPGAAFERDEGILFSTYSTLRGGFREYREDESTTHADLNIRMNQIVQWLGQDFDGIIAFDESHNMANAAPKKGDRGVKPPSQQALAGIELQKRLPNARVLYVSATGATEVENLVYADRLGLWGENTPFSNAQQFIADVSRGGIATMELIARNLKSMGLYLARSLSYAGVKYDRIIHDLDAEQQAKYNELARAWQIVLHNINEAVEVTGSSKAGAHMSAFWGAHQRFFNQVITTMQMPSAIEQIKKDIEGGKAVIMQMVNTDEAQQERALSRRQKGQDLEDLDMTPRENLIAYLQNGFPVQQYEDYTDENGNERQRPVYDSKGDLVINREAAAMRDRLIARVSSIVMPSGPLEYIIQQLGHENVSEVTGRSRRIVINSRTGKMELEKRSNSAVAADVDDFINDKKQVLVFSGKGATGRSFHADKRFKNKRQRRHYLIQPGWRADKAVQGLGRSHRSNQVSDPEFVLVTTNLKGQARFLSSIARRLDQLGALTKGERKTGSQGIFQARDNLESDYAKQALYRYIDDIVEGNADISLEDFESQTGLKLWNEQTGVDVPPITKFLNRLLSMEIETQNSVFEEFSNRLDSVIQEHADNGTLDVGIETIKGLKVEKAAEQVVFTDQQTGAHTKYVQIDVTTPARRLSYDEVLDRYSEGDFYRNTRSGQIWAASGRRTRTNSSGNAVAYRTLTSPQWTHQRHDESVLAQEQWEKLDKRAAKAAWNQAYGQLPETVVNHHHLITGNILPIWNRLVGIATVYRMQTDDGERFLGRVIHPENLQQTMQALDIAAGRVEFDPKEVKDQVLLQGAIVRLNDKWKLFPVDVSGERRIELTGPRWGDMHWVENSGIIVENIQFTNRYFVPVGEEAESVIESVVKHKPIVSIQVNGGPRLSGAQFSRRMINIGQAGSKAKDISKAVKTATKNWKNAPKIKVVQKQSDLPAAIKKEIPKNSLVDAVYYRGTIHLVSDNLSGEEHALSALLHEAMGHYGLKIATGDELLSVLKDLFIAKRNEMQAIADDYGWSLDNELDRLKTADEWFAREAAKEGTSSGWLNRIISAIRSWVRRIFPSLEFTDGEIRELLVAARKMVTGSRRPNRTVMETRAPAFSSSKMAERWFSQMHGFLQQKLTNGPADVIANNLKAWASKGMFKQEELEWSGVLDWLKDQKGKVSKQDVLDYLTVNNIRIEEVERGPDTKKEVTWEMAAEDLGYNPEEREFMDDWELSEIEHHRASMNAGGSEAQIEGIAGGTKYHRWQVPGGSDYREILLTLPTEKYGIITVPKDRFRRLSNSKKFSQGETVRLQGGDYRFVRETNDSVILGSFRIGETLTDSFISSHWPGHPNVISHVRFNSREVDGKKVLFIEEIQSDWHQKGRERGYKVPFTVDDMDIQIMPWEKAKTIVDPALSDKSIEKHMIEWRKENDIPLDQPVIIHKLKSEKNNSWGVYWGKIESKKKFFDDYVLKDTSPYTNYGRHQASLADAMPNAPFKKTWPLLSFKRMVRLAAEKGYDSIAWTTGAIQAERYDLSKQIDTLSYAKKNGKWDLTVYKGGDAILTQDGLDDNGLVDFIGKDIAKKIIDGVGRHSDPMPTGLRREGYDHIGDLTGLDLKVGGEGMKKFYDAMLPSIIDKFFNKKTWGNPKTTTLDILSTDENFSQEYPYAVYDDSAIALAGEDDQLVDVFRTEADAQEYIDEHDDGGLYRIEYKGDEKLRVWSLPITEQMRHKALTEGMPLFSRRKNTTKINHADVLSGEVQERIKAARGVPEPTVLDRLAEGLKEIKRQRAHFPELEKIDDKTLRAQLNDVLRLHQEIPETVKNQAIQMIHGLTEDLSKDGFEVYRMNIILADMLRDTNKGLLEDGNLPFGFETVDQVQRAFDAYQKLANDHAEVKDALRRRNEMVNDIKRKLVAAKLLKKEVMDDEDYFHHQVLQYWSTKHGLATGSAEVRTKWRPWMASRKGSALDYNTEYVEAEFMAISQQLSQLQTVDTLKRIKETADIYAKLKQDARAANLQALYDKLKKAGKIEVDEKTGEEKDPLAAFKAPVAWSNEGLGKMAAHGELEYDSEWDDFVEGLADAWEQHHAYLDDGLEVGSFGYDNPRWFHFLSYLLDKQKPGANYAATIFKAIKARDRYIQDTLGEDFKTFKNMIPEGYVIWKPEPNKGWFWANTIADNVLQKLVSGEIDPKDVEFRKILARGRELVWVIPDGLAKTMDRFYDPGDPSWIGRKADWFQSFWKQYILLNPLSVVRYNINNMSGDLDAALAYAPEIASKKYSVRAAREVWAWMNNKKLPKNIQDELDEARRLGVLGSGFSVQEVEDVIKVLSMDSFVKHAILMESPNRFNPKTWVQNYWSWVQKATAWRENILRLAAYRYFLDNSDKKLYGASKVVEVDAISDPKERAAKLSRELLGDYGNISRTGQWVRKRLMPFYSWLEINAPRYVYMMRNTKYENREAGSVAGRTAALAGKKVIMSAGKMALRASMLYGAVMIWNMLFFPDEERDLGETGRRQLHIILGRREDGTIISIRFQGALSDALSWFGLEDWPQDIKDVASGAMTVGEKAKAMAEDAWKAVLNRVVQAIRPDVKMFGEIASGYSFYPDVTRPMPIRDKVEHALRTFKLDSLYRTAMGRPGRGKTPGAPIAVQAMQQLANDLTQILTYRSDPGMIAYYDTRAMVFDYLAQSGDEKRFGGKPTNKSNAMYWYKQALKYGDLDAAHRYMKKYKELGGNEKSKILSIRNAHPLSSIPKHERYKFRKSLTPQQERVLKLALDWYKKTYGNNENDK